VKVLQGASRKREEADKTVGSEEVTREWRRLVWVDRETREVFISLPIPSERGQRNGQTHFGSGGESGRSEEGLNK